MSMDFTMDQLHSLLTERQGGSVSIFAPVHRPSDGRRADKIRLKNLFQQCQRQLLELGFRSQDVDDRLTRLRRRIEQVPLWREEGCGLAAFAGSDMLCAYRLPAEVKPLAVVGERFHVKPLLPLINEQPRFYVLALSQNTVRLLEAGRYEARPMRLQGAPANFAEITRFDERQRHLEFHTGTAGHGPGADRPAVFHGQGAGGDDAIEKKRLLEYSRRIDEAVCRVLRGLSGPLLLATAEPLLGVYRQANTYPHLDDRVINGCPDEAGVGQLHAEGVKLLAPDFDRRLTEDAERYRQAAGNGHGSDDLCEVLEAAHIDQVDTVFVALDEHRWGRFDPKNGQAELHPSRQGGDEDLLDLAAARVMLGGGLAHAVERKRMPTGKPVAASFRFSLA